MKKMVFGIFLVVLAFGCTKQDSVDLPTHIKDLENLTVYSSDAEPPYQIKLDREETFGDTEEVLIGVMTDMAVDEAGQVYIADGKQLDIKVYEPGGRFLTLLGRQGSGPGEFSEISNVQIKENRLFVYDRDQQRAVVFFLDSLVYDYTVNLAGNRNHFNELRDAYLSSYYVRENSTLLMKFTKSNLSESMNDWDKIEITGLYYLLDDKGRIMPEKLFEMKSSIQVLVPYGGRSVGTPAEFLGVSLLALSDNNHVYLAWSGDIMIKVYSPNGEYERAFYYPYDRVPLTPESAFNTGTHEFIQRSMQSMDLPATWPALKAMLLDDEDRIWISTIVEDNQVYEWWVLQDTGELITKFTWPRDQPIQAVKNGYLYARETDEMDVASIVRYRIEVKNK